MNKEERAELKEKIIETITETRRKIQQLEAATQPITPENAIGRVSRMDAINNKSVAEATLRTARRKLSSLETALHKVEDAHFGKCTRCGQAIRPARLMFMPESERCIRCADRA
ncbi:MAG TPA: TraR/DksA C4-type zinc finger protein [Saprospiraceae bacterium]|nr:TraR/DksA C4-type zinc finger protein [Saprospiraceae bacterium]